MSSKVLTSRKPPAPMARKVPFRDAKLIILATEGTVTEPHYFSMFTTYGDEFFNPKVRRIDVLETPGKDESGGGESAPPHVINRLLDYIKENDIKEDDKLWLVLDVDRWKKQGVLGPVIAAAHAKGILVAISNPCFEVWLLCHFIDNLSEIGTLRSAVRNNLGNVKSKFDLSVYKDQVRRAVDVARNSSGGSDPNIPDKFGSYVYKVILDILPNV